MCVNAATRASCKLAPRSKRRRANPHTTECETRWRCVNMADTNQHENGGDTAELLPRQGRNALQPLRVTSPTPPGVGSPQLGTPTWGGDSSIAAATATQAQPAPVTDGHEPVPYYDGQDYKQDGGANGNYAGAHGEAGDASGSDIDDDLAKHLQGAVVAARVSRGEILAEQAADHQYYTQAEIDVRACMWEGCSRARRPHCSRGVEPAYPT